MPSELDGGIAGRGRAHRLGTRAVPGHEQAPSCQEARLQLTGATEAKDHGLDAHVGIEAPHGDDEPLALLGAPHSDDPDERADAEQVPAVAIGRRRTEPVLDQAGNLGGFERRELDAQVALAQCAK